MSVVDDLRQIVPARRISTEIPDRVLYGRDLWPRDLIRLRAHDVRRSGPAAVVWPDSCDEVQRIVEYARDSGTPIVPFGAGSGVCGGIAPSESSIVLDLKRLADWQLMPEAGVVEVGAGMLGIHLENELQAQGYTVGHFPSSILCSTVGGWLAARGAGQCSGRYGKIEDMVVSTQAVLGTGDALTMNWRVEGPNLSPLMIGSEGTLGVITRTRLRVHALPEQKVFSGFAFRDVESGWQALRDIYQAGLRPAVARLYDALDTALHSQSSAKPGSPSALIKTALRIPQAINRVAQALEGTLLKRCQLVLIFEGDEQAAREDSSHATRLCRRYAGRELGEAPARAWLQHRYSVSYRQAPLFRAGAFSDTMEVAAPWSCLKEVYDSVRAALSPYVIVLAHLSHAYPDGCSIYFTFSARTDSDQRALELYDRLWPEALAAAVAAGATLSHHHGVGRNKAPLMMAELGHGVDMMRRLKCAWDPSQVMNPGALLPSEAGESPFQLPARSPVTNVCEVDEVSQIANLDAQLTLDQAENLLARQGFSLRVEQQGAQTLADWIAAGLPGARCHWQDPVDHTLVALSAKLTTGEGFRLPPAPRRAVGPDLTAFFVGERRLGSVSRVSVRVYPAGVSQARALAGHIASTPLSDAEASAWDRAISAQLT